MAGTRALFVFALKMAKKFRLQKMGEIARIFTFAVCHGRSSNILKNQLSTCLKRPLVCASSPAVCCDRSAHTQDITRNIKHISNDKIKLSVDPQTMKCAEPINKPMCIMLSWLLSKPKHVLKYAELYLEQGYDVISVSCTPWQLMRPMNGVKCTWKCWENSPHVLHYMHHPEEYRDLLLAHLREHTTVLRESASERHHDSIHEKKRATA
ncbi:hypothetical protein RR48_03240 [Papilio machaon]|uniref:Uncharacterized protein n=1 Tax=Papilio machaon TaxID=76193 RepID=A0A0N1INA0_PAPMA|nr:hypothetical protein RR48_03240 [Papilio machaon]